MPSILIPIEFPSGLRIEPEVGFLSGSWNADSENEQLESNTGSFLVGFGVFTLRRSREGVLYLGARLGGLVGSSEDSYSMGGTTRTKTNWSGFFVAPAFGGEFLLSERFGLGAEVQLFYTSLTGKEEVDSVPDTNLSSSSLSTRTLLTARFYFGP
jgi:hypothetical protein